MILTKFGYGWRGWPHVLFCACTYTPQCGADNTTIGDSQYADFL